MEHQHRRQRSIAEDAKTGRKPAALPGLPLTALSLFCKGPACELVFWKSLSPSHVHLLTDDAQETDAARISVSAFETLSGKPKGYFSYFKCSGLST